MLVQLDERRANLAAQRTRVVNQLHAMLRDLIPVGSATTPTLMPRGGQSPRLGAPGGLVEAACKQLGRDLVAEVRVVDVRLAKLTPQCRGPSPNTQSAARG